MREPVDHLDPRGAKFTQRFTLVFSSYDTPMVLNSSGYGIAPSLPYTTPLTYLMNGNEIELEHRFFGESMPESKDWKKLNIFQAASDEHRIIQALRPLFEKKWLTTGISKGGMTATYHRFFYPNDVAATVPYSAPNSHRLGDPRYATFIENVGTAECRERLKSFQTEILRRRPEFEARLAADAAAEGATFNLLGIHGVVDDLVTWGAWRFWQGRLESDCATIPSASATTDELYDYMQYIEYGDLVWADADEGQEANAAYNYQSATELGSPRCSMDHLKPYLTPGYTCDTFDKLPPFGVEKRYQPYSMAIVGAWVKSAATRMIYLYGGNDPWSAGAFDVRSENDSYRYIIPGANHDPSITALPEAQQNEIYDRLERWMEVTIDSSHRLSAKAAAASDLPIRTWRPRRGRLD